MENIFLLGGYDLEMLTVKEILMEKHIKFFDKHLSWHNAFIDEYVDKLAGYENVEDVRFYAIELKYKNLAPIKNLEIIDHHDDLCYGPSALEQVADLLSVDLNRWQLLVSANDRGYIPAMIKVGADEKEINAIRIADRRAQGVKDVDEKMAEEDVENLLRFENLIVVRTRSDKFSPICDRLFPYDRLIIYNECELVYYGMNAYDIYLFVADSYGNDKFYRGGGDSGFVGLKRGELDLLEIKRLVELIRKHINETV